MVKEINGEGFKREIFDYDQHQDWHYKGDKPCIIDFYAPWCAPCKSIAPILSKIAEEYQQELYIYKVNVDENGQLASLFGVSSIPSLLFVSMENLPRIEVGALPPAAILQIMAEELGID